MLRTFGIAGAIAGAALTAVLAGSPASAGSDEQLNYNLQDGAVVCNSDSAKGLIAVNIPLLNYDETGDCGKAAANTNIDD
ncbi:hypothetical protein [Nocardiopsis algeriensis]|uniref:Small secreted domain DUF320 n=1 Tax=Nocardiopsis algeriensis TaxID=1478215 RepID=A0A841IQN4_9ACTN|nr:hypothetical protein [Nocardiopsis algeriensis]MBB6120973.1 hypothetical protein [Nocardiopsis algeriensis]